MARRRSREARCDRTLDLIDWLDQQRPVAEIRQFDPSRIRAATVRARVARAVSETLRDCGMPREDVARRMGEVLGEEVSVNMLNAYASEARAEHSIPYLRLLALVQVTGDFRALQLAAEGADAIVVSRAVVPWINHAVEAQRIERITELARLLRRDHRRRAAQLGGADAQAILAKLRAA